MDDAAPGSALPPPHRTLLGYLAAQAEDPDTRIFAAVDGAFFQNVDADLRDAGLTRRLLYRYAGHYAVVMGGPWMIDPYHHDRTLQEELTAGVLAAGQGKPFADIASDDLPTIRHRLEAIVRVAGGKPGLVFWIGSASLTAEAFYRHLRRLNMVQIRREKDRVADAAGDLAKAALETTPSAAETAYELVIFRHADSNVLAQVIPALDGPGQARLLGPCRELLYLPDEEWGGRPSRLRRPPENGTAEDPSGPLRWEPETLKAIGERRMVPFDRQLEQALRAKYPGRSFGRGGPFLDSVRHYRRQAQARFRISIDQHVMDYLEIVLLRGDSVIEDRQFRQTMALKSLLMEEKCQRLRQIYLVPPV